MRVLAVCKQQFPQVRFVSVDTDAATQSRTGHSRSRYHQFNQTTTSLMMKIRISKNNIKDWPKFETLLKEGKIKFDSVGRLRYLHGAPVGDLILTSYDKKGCPIYLETTIEWFDPDSSKANEFIWP